MATLRNAAVALFTSAIGLVAAQDTIIPPICRTGVQVVALPGSGIANGTTQYGFSSNFVAGILGSIPGSASISFNYERMLSVGNSAWFEPEINWAVPQLFAALQTYTTLCPNTPIVLHGYSEGAVVVGNLVCGASSAGFDWTKGLSTSWASQIIAVVVYGDETRTAGQPYNYGGCTANAPYLPRYNPAGCGAFIPAMQSYCFPDDPDCCGTANPNDYDAPNGTPWHWNYPQFDYNSVSFIMNRYQQYIEALSPSLPTGFVSQGCFADSPNRAFPVQLYQNSTNSNSQCALACRAAGYVYSGTEYSNECHCGNSLPSAPAPSTDCNMGCSGNPNQNCGAGWRLTVQKDTTPNEVLPAGIVAQGCFVDNANPRPLSTRLFSNSSTTNSMCAIACRQAGFTFSGTEYSQECYCGNTLPSVNALPGDCYMPCAGNSNAQCGGPNRLSVMQDFGAPAAPSSTSTPTPTPTLSTTSRTIVPVPSTTLSTVTTSAAPSPTPTTLTTLTTSSTSSTLTTLTTIASPPAAPIPTSIYPPGIKPLGCYVDNASRVLPASPFWNNSNTNALCALACRASGYVFSGTEYTSQCFCGASAPPQIASSSDCNMPCAGDSSQICGGPYRLSVMQDLTPNSTPIPTGVVSVGCFVDNAYLRVLPVSPYWNSSNTIGLCATACSQGGYAYSGTEYTTQCFCGKLAPLLPALSSDCNMACAGDSTQMCGGPNRLTVYKDTTLG